MNTAGTSLSSCRIDGSGYQQLLSAVAAGTGAGPTDATLSPDSTSPRVRQSGGTVAVASADGGRDGSLTAAGTAVGTAVGPVGRRRPDGYVGSGLRLALPLLAAKGGSI